MCLYTYQKAPKDMTGTVAYKGYRVVNGSLVTPHVKEIISSLEQRASGAPDVGYDFSYWGDPNRRRVGKGYVHAVVDSNALRPPFDIVIKGRLIGQGWLDEESGEVCAEGFRMDEIFREVGMRTIELDAGIVVEGWMREITIVASYDVEDDGFVYVPKVEVPTELLAFFERLAAQAIKERMLLDFGDND